MRDLSITGYLLVFILFLFIATCIMVVFTRRKNKIEEEKGIETNVPPDGLSSTEQNHDNEPDDDVVEKVLDTPVFPSKSNSRTPVPLDQVEHQVKEDEPPTPIGKGQGNSSLFNDANINVTNKEQIEENQLRNMLRVTTLSQAPVVTATQKPIPVVTTTPKQPQVITTTPKQPQPQVVTATPTPKQPQVVTVTPKQAPVEKQIGNQISNIAAKLQLAGGLNHFGKLPPRKLTQQQQQQQQEKESPIKNKPNQIVSDVVKLDKPKVPRSSKDQNARNRRNKAKRGFQATGFVPVNNNILEEGQREDSTP